MINTQLQQHYGVLSFCLKAKELKGHNQQKSMANECCVQTDLHHSCMI